MPDTLPPKAIASVVIVKLYELAAIVEPVVNPEADKVTALPKVTAPV